MKAIQAERDRLQGGQPGHVWNRFDAQGKGYLSSVAPKKGDQDFEDALQVPNPAASHSKQVADAIAAGKAVPPEVLADYPDLSPQPSPVGGEVANALHAIPAGDTGHVGGWLVNRTGPREWRVHTDKGHVTGGPREIAAHLEADRKLRDLDKGRAEAALARTQAHSEPDALQEPDRHAAEQAAFAGLPAGARVVSLDPRTRGRLGSVVRENGQALVQLDGDPAAAPTTHVEPLDPGQSWRAPPPKPAGPKAEAGRLFGREEMEKPAAHPLADPAAALGPLKTTGRLEGDYGPGVTNAEYLEAQLKKAHPGLTEGEFAGLLQHLHDAGGSGVEFYGVNGLHRLPHVTPERSAYYGRVLPRDRSEEARGIHARDKAAVRVKDPEAAARATAAYFSKAPKPVVDLPEPAGPKPPAARAPAGSAGGALADKLLAWADAGTGTGSSGAAALGGVNAVSNALRGEKFAGDIKHYDVATALDENKIIGEKVAPGGGALLLDVPHPEALRAVLDAAKSGRHDGRPVASYADLARVAREAAKRPPATPKRPPTEQDQADFFRGPEEQTRLFGEGA